MIYIEQAIVIDFRIPRTTAAPTTNAVLTFTSTVGRADYVIPVEDLAVEGDYYLIRADFSALKTAGEYEYHLDAGGVNLAAGVATVGTIPNAVPEQYEKPTTYEQYEQA